MSNVKKSAADFAPEGSVEITTVLHDPEFVAYVPVIETWRDAPAVKADSAKSTTKPAESAHKKEN